jgi:hypothetical protein
VHRKVRIDTITAVTLLFRWLGKALVGKKVKMKALAGGGEQNYYQQVNWRQLTIRYSLPEARR